MPGYDVQTVGATAKKRFAIALVHSGVQPLCLAAVDQIDMRKWFLALEQATKSESQQISGSKDSVTTSTKDDNVSYLIKYSHLIEVPLFSFRILEKLFPLKSSQQNS